MKILYLPLKKQWYEMIESGEKKEEYRLLKPYWEKRLLDYKKLVDYYETHKTVIFPAPSAYRKPSRSISTRL